MGLQSIFILSLTEIIGDFALKKFANAGGLMYLLLGIVGYIGVIFWLIVSLQGSTILMVNGGWDGISSIIESIAAYVFLGERFHNYWQYVGLLCIFIGLYLLHIPVYDKHPFHIPKL